MKQVKRTYNFEALGALDRRSFLKAIPIGLISGKTFSFSFPSLTAAIAGENYSQWDYEHPEQWGDISPEYQVCKTGNQQSPIDLHSDRLSASKPVEIHYQDIPLRIVNNGKTIEVDNKLENFIVLDGEKFELVQFHFHHPSEHTVMGKNYPMEIHFVHKNEQGTLAVLAVFLKKGSENKALMPIWDSMPSQKSAEKYFGDVKIATSKLLPKNLDSYRYSGSLTTPPCSENVSWVVFQEPVEVSPEHFQQFDRIVHFNARPRQAINRRSILTSS